MTVADAIKHFDDLKQYNDFDEEYKLAWLSELDGLVINETINTHEGEHVTDFQGYVELTEEEQEGTTLLIPEPYSDAYLYFMSMKSDNWNRESASYNDALMMFQALYSDFQAFYTRNHQPLERAYFKL